MVLDKYISDLCQKINDNQSDLCIFFKKSHIVKQRIPPILNENKMVYGKLIELLFIEYLNKIFDGGCSELDKKTNIGSSYMNDCNIRFNNEHSMKLSIKVSAQGGDIILINKHNNNINYNSSMEELITLVIRLDKCELLILPHVLVLNWEKEYKRNIFRNNQANLKYGSPLFTLFYGKIGNRLPQGEIDKYKISLDNMCDFEKYKKNVIEKLEVCDWRYHIFKILFNDLNNGVVL